MAAVVACSARDERGAGDADSEDHFDVADLN